VRTLPAAWLGCVALLCLGGCGVFGSKDSPVEQPAELTDIEPTFSVRKAWEYKAGSGSEKLGLALRPAVEGARVFVAGRDGEVHALDIETGKRGWIAETELELSAGTAVGQGLVVVGSSDGMVAALDAADGTLRWQEQLSGEVLAAPALSPTAVVVRTVDGRLYALAPETGRQLWSAEQRPPRLSLRGTAAPVIAGNLVVTAFDNGKVAAFALRDGEPRWEQTLSVGRGRTEIERLMDLDATPQVIGQDVYVVGYRGRIVNLALESGQVLWVNDMSSHAGLGVDWTTVYVTAAEDAVIALNRSSGGELWRQDALRLRRLTAPTPVARSVVVGDFEGWLHWLDPVTGAVQVRYRAGKSAFVVPPVNAGELVIAQDENDRVYALRAEPRG
jgi:outer membrane protein assembly factor BamB